MTQVTFRGTPVNLKGELVKVGDKLDQLKFTNGSLEDVALEAYKGQVVVLNLFPSVDTGVCATSVREFNERAGSKEGVKVLCVSGDLPFAQARFCGAEGLDRVENLSTFRFPCSAEKLGLRFADGPLAGLVHRAVVVLNKDLEVTYVQVSPEVGEHVDYEAAVAAVDAQL